MVSSSAATVPEYLASLPPERLEGVAAMRRFIREHLPKGYREAMGRRPDMGKFCLRFTSPDELIRRHEAGRT